MGAGLRESSVGYSKVSVENKEVSKEQAMEVVVGYVDCVRAFGDSSNEMAQDLHTEILELQQEMGENEDTGELHETLMEMIGRLEGAIHLQKGSVGSVTCQLEESLNETPDISRHLNRAADLINDDDASAADVLTEAGAVVGILTRVMYGGRVAHGVLSDIADMHSARTMMVRILEGEIDAAVVVADEEEEEVTDYVGRLIQILRGYRSKDDELTSEHSRILTGSAGILQHFIEKVVCYEDWLMKLFETDLSEDCGPTGESARRVLESVVEEADAGSLSP